MKYQSLEARLWARVQRSDKQSCWPWVGAKNSNGYGRIAARELGGPIVEYAHRAAWAMANRLPLRRDVVVCHHCDNPICCNPFHLFSGTHLDNSRDMDRKGRRSPPVGDKNGKTRLRDVEIAIVRAMRAQGFSYVDIASCFEGVTANSLSRIVSGKRRTKCG